MNKKILLLGEVCHDVFIYGNCDRLNPEAPSPVFEPINTKTNQGMAGNTLSNLKHLGFDVTIINEAYGCAITKTRYVETKSNHILLRVDEEDDGIITIDRDDFENFINNYNLIDYDAIVVSDYDKGLLSQVFLADLFEYTKELGISTFMDTKKSLGHWARNCDYIKVNEKEYDESASWCVQDIPESSIIVTLGADGCRWMNNNYVTETIDVRDVVGAGDTFLAGLVYGMFKYNNLPEALKLANKLATDVVKHKGVSVPNKNLL